MTNEDKMNPNKLREVIPKGVESLGDKPELPEDAIDILDSGLSMAEKGLVLAAAYNISVIEAMKILIKSGK